MNFIIFQYFIHFNFSLSHYDLKICYINYKKFHNIQRDGIWKHYENGIVVSEGTYKNGKENGLFAMGLGFKALWLSVTTFRCLPYLFNYVMMS